MLATDLSGRKLGPYELSRRIGSGGMSAVYEAFQPQLNRKVAVKVLSEYLTQDASFAARFRREAGLIVRLEHAHIAPVYDYATDGDYSYIAMRLLTGSSLERRLTQFGKPSTYEALGILNQIASALDYAHKQGVIHRDLKPSNVLLDDSGNAFLSDFGVARLFDSTEHITATGQTIGTPLYMSPEQVMSQKIDHRADIYAFGVIAFVLFTGQLPFEGDEPFAVALKHAQEAPPNPSSFAPDLPRELDAVFAKVLAKQPEARYQAAADFVAALEDAFAGKLTRSKTDFLQGAVEQEGTEAEEAITGISYTPLPQSAIAPGQALDTLTPLPYAPDAAYDFNIPLTARKAPGLRLLISAVIVILILIVGLFFLLTSSNAASTGGGGSPVLLVVIVGALVGVGAWIIYRRAAPPRSKPAQPSITEQKKRETIELDTLVQAPVAEPVPPSPPPIAITDTVEVPAITDNGEAPAVPERPKPMPARPPVRTMESLKEGERLGDYELRKRLDKGDRNRVFEAYDHRHGWEVAIKVLNLAAASGQERALRFKQEAQILGGLNHPHIVRFLDYATEGELNYIVMPLLRGGTLRDRMPQDVGNLPRAVTTLRQVASALDYLHSKNVIHRDLKASNVMFDDDGNSYLVDFGIAKMTNMNAALTMVGQLIGTPAYMAPEQWLGVELTPASDQYALGTLAFQMLTGQLPFDAPNTPGLMYKHVYDPPPAVTSLRPELPGSLNPVFTRVLAKKPDERYPSTRAFVEALEGLAGDKPSRPVSGHVFISYSRHDQDYARELADHIRQNGFPVWIDDRIDYGDQWFKEIEKAIKASAAFVVVMTPDSDASEWVHREILIAKREKKLIFPLLLQGQEFGILIDIQYADVRASRLPPADFYGRLRGELTSS
jgi:serine/threonine-protein kinase